MLPTSTELNHFMEIFRTRHLSNAAIRLGITQPALTQSIKKLEEKTGGPLFHRTKQGMVPTKLGLAFYQNSGELLDTWSKIESDLRISREHLVGRFRFGCHQSVAGYCLPKLLKRLDSVAPTIELELVHDFSRKVLEKIVNFELDAGFVVNPTRHPDLVLKHIGDDEVSFWIRHQRSGVPKRLLVDMNLIQISQLLGQTHASHFKGWTLLQSSSLEVIRTMILSGNGVGILPQRVVQADGASVERYDKALPTFKDKIYFVYRKAALNSRAGKALIELCSHPIDAVHK